MTKTDIFGNPEHSSSATRRKSKAEIFNDYDGFVEKFKPKKTTDDCYTPPAVYEAVLSRARELCGIPGDAPIVRPFWPGGDYERYDYPEGCVVVDNPPFSIITRIRRFYKERGISYFLFAPSLTLFSGCGGDECFIVTDTDITYENGAVVRTAFVTNMLPEWQVITDWRMRKYVQEAQAAAKGQGHELSVYDYPANLITAARLQKVVREGVELRFPREECHFIRKLDAQGEKGIFGGGFLISEKAAAEKAAAEKAAAEKAAAEKAAAEKAAARARIEFPLSPAERAIIHRLDEAAKNRPGHPSPTLNTYRQ